MSQIVTGNSDALAAEYVLGTLDPEERTQARALLEIDQEFVAKVRLWERRLGELHLMVEPVEPEGKIWERIKAKMPEFKPSPDVSPPPAEAGAPAPGASETPKTLPPSPTLHVPAAGASLPPTPTLPLTPITPSTSPAGAGVAAPASSLTATSLTPTPPTLTASTPASKPAVAAVPTPGVARAPEVETKVERQKDPARVIQGRLTRWRAFALLMTLLVLAVAALLASWRLVPERVPPVLRPAEVMRLMGVTIAGSASPRRPAPPESQFDE